MYRKIITFLLFSIAMTMARAQTCTIQASTNKVCLGSTVTFSIVNPDINDSAWSWNFGSGGSSTQRNPTYQYPSAGAFNVSLTVYRKGGAVCNATPINVMVFHKPVAGYGLQSQNPQCFENNKFVFLDQSQPGLSNAPIKKRVFVFDDGSILQENAPFNATVSHTYTDPAGDKYIVAIEVTDTNNCISQYIDSVVVASKRQPIVFTATSDIQCNETRVIFSNLSPYDSTNSKSIKWIVDSNVVFTSPWRTLHYTYKGNRRFQPRLIIEDNYGCIDSVDLGYDIFSFVPDSVISVQKSTKSCFRNNIFSFSNSTLLGNFIWTITDANNKTVVAFNQASFSHTFLTCGLYNVKLFYFYNSCTFESDTQVFVYGPAAVMHNDTAGIINWVQCTPHDTVYFNMPELSCKFNNGALQYLWDFDDPSAPPCITNTRLGQNVGVNCRFSADSVRVKHFYHQTNPRCYRPSLIMVDPVLGCGDTTVGSLRIAQPLAGWDSSFVPPQPRVYVEQTNCSYDVLFKLERLLPACGPEEVWLFPDSGCVNRSGWIKIDTMGIYKEFPFSYLNICDTIDYKYVFGIVVINGKNGSGQTCYDTTWYHEQLKMPTKVDFDFEFKDNGLCKPFPFVFTPKDTIMKDIKEVAWHFGDGNPVLRINYTANDSIIKPQLHAFAQGGMFPVTFSITTTNGCIASNMKPIIIGKSAFLDVDDADICVGKKSVFDAAISYNSQPTKDYWGDTIRRNQGKEQLYWNFGDSGKWVPGLTKMEHTYANPGSYTAQIAYKDSTSSGCFDTVLAIVLVRAIKGQIFQYRDTFYCAPSIVSFIDSSYTQEDTFSRQYNVFRREWNFGADRPPSQLVNPSIFYPQNGTYKAQLYVESIHGCSQLVEKEFVILGPQPRFVILEDTFGCMPFTVKFRNQTPAKLKTWIWDFGDPLLTTLSTNQDTDVYFTYNVPGVYEINLLGKEDIFDPVTGTFKECPATFPYVDASTPHSRSITVLSSDTLKIVSPDEVCINEVFSTTVKDSFYVAMVEWIWGDGNSNSMVPILSQATHSYDSSGMFRLRVNPVITAKGQCVLPAEKNITVQKPMADFEFAGRAYPTFAFTNTSQSAVRYLWDFGQPFSTANSSTEKDPEHTFVIENNPYKVCLMAFDDLDCMDSVCKILPLRSSVKIPNVFTPANKDGQNDAFDIDIEGWSRYELFIYNRWGTLVFEGDKDGFHNDGVNWDGRNKNDGSECPEGVYYVVFRYKLLTNPSEEVYHGTVTLIRE